MKDAYVMLKQMKFFCFAMVVMAIIPSNFTRGFAIMYASMMPITTMAFDEQAKWDSFAAMMPYKKRDLALSKYVVGLGALLLICVLEVAAILVIGTLQGQPLIALQGNLITVCLIAVMGTLLMSLNLPIIFKMGAERGRIAYIIITVIVSVTVVSSLDVKSAIWQIPENTLILLFVAGAVIALLASMAISVKIYKNTGY